MITIKVTRKHIKKGKPEQPDSCPIALALREVIKGKVKVFDHDIDLGDYEENSRTFYYIRLDLPRSARRFVVRFDDRKKVKPFSFKLPMS